MVFELLQVVLVSIVVLFIPGYAWTRVLFAALDWPERVTLAIALSMALVPALALLLSQIFGPGVTLPVALAAVVLVTISGAAAYSFLGPARVCDISVAPRQPALGAPALIALILASLLLVATSLQILKVGSTAIYIALLLALTVALHLVERRRSWRPSVSEPDDFKINALAETAEGRAGAITGGEVGRPLTVKPSLGGRLLASRRFLLGGILLLVLVRAYSGPILHDWPYIRGQDLYAHTAMINLVMSQGSAESILVYPPGFHILIAVMTRLGGPEPLDLFPLLAPAMLLLPTLACYVLASRLFGPDYGLAAAFFIGAVSNSAYLYINDGMYTNLISAHFLFVLALLTLFMLLRAPSARNGALVAVLGSSVVLWHSVASIYVALILLIVSVVYLPYLLLRERRTGVALLLALVALASLSLYYVWDAYDIPQTALAFLGRGGATGTTDHAAIAVGTFQPRNAQLYLAHLSPAVGWLGLLGALLIASNLKRVRPAGLPALALLLLWCALFFAASRTSLSAFPIRFTRDLGVPLSITAAFALVTVMRSSLRSRPVAIIAASLISLTVLLGAQQGLSRGSSPSNVVFMTPGIEAAGAWLRRHNTGGSIIVSPHRNQVSGNAMLAMGRYSELPAYAPWQLGIRRQIPPRDHQAVRDGLFVLSHPGSAKTRKQILEQYDVRYIVMYKRLHEGSFWADQNQVKWQRFLNRPRLYERAFENESVIIFKVLQNG